MTTQTIMKAEITSDLDDRSDLVDEIASAITSAITHSQRDRFYWNEKRSLTFSTVASQQNYTSSDAANIPNMLRIDQAHITVSGQRRELRRVNFYELETLYDTSASSGEPFEYAYHDREIWLYPIPSTTYTVRVLGHMIVAAPATDGEASNPWMTEAYELIRCRAKAYLAMHKLRDPELAQSMQAMEADALARLRKETALRLGTGMFTPTEF
jgi:hypothetical protein